MGKGAAVVTLTTFAFAAFAPSALADSGLLSSVTRPATPVTTQLTQTVAPVAQTVAQTAAPVANAVAPVTTAVAQTAAPVTVPVAAAVAPVAKAVEPVTTSVAPVIEPVVSAVEPIVQAVEPVTAPVTAAVQPVVRAVAPAAALVVAPLQPVTAKATQTAVQVVADTPSAPPAVPPPAAVEQLDISGISGPATSPAVDQRGVQPSTTSRGLHLPPSRVLAPAATSPLLTFDPALPADAPRLPLPQSHATTSRTERTGSIPAVPAPDAPSAPWTGWGLAAAWSGGGNAPVLAALVAALLLALPLLIRRLLPVGDRAWTPVALSVSAPPG